MNGLNPNPGIRVCVYNIYTHTHTLTRACTYITDKLNECSLATTADCGNGATATSTKDPQETFSYEEEMENLSPETLINSWTAR